MILNTLRTLGFFSILVVTAAAARAQPGNWAEAMFEKLDHDFGIVARGAEAKYRLKIVNKYPDPVHFVGVGTICTCVTPKLSHSTLAPGEEGYLELSFDTKKFRQHKDTTLFVTLDRPQYAEVRIPVKAYIRTDVVLTPGSADFGSIEKGAQAERKIAIAYAGRPDWTIKSVVNKSKHFDVKLHETARAGGAVNYELAVALKATAPAGELREQVILVTDDPANPHIPMLVEARIEAEYSINLELVDFGTLTPGARKTINVIVRGRKPFTIDKIESEKTAGTFEVRLPKEPKPLHILPLTVIAPAEAGTLKEEFTITIGGAAEPLVFKAQCRVVPATAARP